MGAVKDHLLALGSPILDEFDDLMELVEEEIAQNGRADLQTVERVSHLVGLWSGLFPADNLEEFGRKLLGAAKEGWRRYQEALAEGAE